MDPVTCLKMALELMQDGEREEAADRLEDLANWLRNGGFIPRVKSRGSDVFRKVWEVG